MSDQVLRGVTLATAIGAGVVAGVFFTFSTFVMKALAALPPTDGLRAMQSINVAAPTPLFMTALFGTGVGIAALAVASVGEAPSQASVLRFVAAAAYLVAVIGLTVGYHVPHNDALAGVDPSAPEAAAAWAAYAPAWTAWNHVRTIGAVIAAAALTWSLRLG